MYRENLTIAYEQRRHRPACASTQSDQLLRYSLSGKQYRSTFYTQNFNILVSLCRWADIGLILQTQYYSY